MFFIFSVFPLVSPLCKQVSTIQHFSFYKLLLLVENKSVHCLPHNVLFIYVPWSALLLFYILSVNKNAESNNTGSVIASCHWVLLLLYLLEKATSNDIFLNVFIFWYLIVEGKQCNGPRLYRRMTSSIWITIGNKYFLCIFGAVMWQKQGGGNFLMWPSVIYMMQ